MILVFVDPLWSFLQWFTNLLITKNNYERDWGEGSRQIPHVDLHEHLSWLSTKHITSYYMSSF